MRCAKCKLPMLPCNHTKCTTAPHWICAGHGGCGHSIKLKSNKDLYNIMWREAEK